MRIVWMRNGKPFWFAGRDAGGFNVHIFMAHFYYICFKKWASKKPEWKWFLWCSDEMSMKKCFFSKLLSLCRWSVGKFVLVLSRLWKGVWFVWAFRRLLFFGMREMFQKHFILFFLQFWSNVFFLLLLNILCPFPFVCLWNDVSKNFGSFSWLSRHSHNI